MLKISWFEFVVRGIPEEFLFVLAVHAFSKTGINLKKYLLSGVLLWIMAYLIRLLPIQYGVHTILGLIVLIVLVSSVNKIDIIKSIRAGIIIFTLVFIFEGINVFFIQSVLKKDINIIMGDHILKTLYGLPSVMVFGIVVLIYYFRLSKRRELDYV
jgi:hypothetical protein